MKSKLSIRWFVASGRGEQGISVIFVALLLAVFVGLLALALDFSRYRLAVRHIQDAADAAALAAARRLDGTANGWRTAKRFAIKTLRQQTLSGVSADTLKNLSFKDSDVGEKDELECLTLGGGRSYCYINYQSNAALKDNLFVRIEHGVYWDQGGTMTFRSLESQPLEAVDEPDDPSEQPPRVPMYHKMPVYLIANAMRVTVENREIPSVFGKFLNFTGFHNTSRRSVAVASDDFEYSVAPLAIPACSLLLDTSPSRDSKYLTLGFFPRFQCSRELLFTEADPSNLAAEPLSEGRLRSSWYPRPPTYNETFARWRQPDQCYNTLPAHFDGGFNCKAVPLRGVFGVPVTDDSSAVTPATQSELLQAFSSDNAIVARVGMRFKPYEAHNPPTNLAANLRTLILSANENEDLTPAGGNYPYRYFPSPNFPTPAPGVSPLSNPDPALVNRWGMMSYLMGPASHPLDFQNPLCQDPQLNHNRLRRPENRQRIQAKRMFAMVIAPSASNTMGYCSYPELFKNVPQSTDAPDSNSHPIVVGFVPLSIFDFNFDKLGNGGTTVSLPGDNSPQAVVLKDMTAQGGMRAFVSYPEQHRRLYECQQIPVCQNGQNPQKDGCRDYSCSAPPPPPPPDGGININGIKAREADYNLMYQCYYTPPFDDLVWCVEKLLASDWLSLVLDQLFGTFGAHNCLGIANNLLTDSYGPRWDLAGVSPPAEFDPRFHCLPSPRPQCLDWGNTACWDLPEPRRADHGCAGIRARLDCRSGTNGVTLFSPLTYAQRAPALVQSD